MERIDFDRYKSMRELDLRSLEAGDMVIVDTESGSKYRFSVKSNEYGDTLATMERRSDHSPVEQSDHPVWERIEQNALFRLIGSCKSVSRMENGLIAVDTTDGHFVVGERAHIETGAGDEGSTLITSTVEAIQLEKPIAQ